MAPTLTHTPTLLDTRPNFNGLTIRYEGNSSNAIMCAGVA